MPVGYTAEEYVLRQSRNLIAGSELEVRFHCFCDFSKLILQCQKKMMVRICTTICRQEMSSEDLILYDRRKKELALKSKGVINPGLNILGLSGAESL